jgi:hypothetical protein
MNQNWVTEVPTLVTYLLTLILPHDITLDYPFFIGEISPKKEIEN